MSGISIVSAFGTTHQPFVEALLQGRSAIAPVTGFDATRCRTTLAAQTSNIQLTDWMPPMKLRRLERTGVYAVALTRLAFEDAGRTATPAGDDHSGVVLGTWTAGGQSSQVYLDALFGGGPTNAPAILFESTVGNAAASLAGLEFKLRGPNMTVSHKEASGLLAIVSAVDMLRLQRAKGLVAGAVDVIYETFFKAHDRFSVMSPAPGFSRATAPFDTQRSGFVLGEGGVGLWLELADEAQSSASRARHGWILGTGVSSSAVPLNAWPDSTEPLVRTMRLALDDAGLAPADVHVVYASANATTTLDRIEALALHQLFGGRRPVVTSIKGAIGEGGMSGAVGCAAALLCGREGQVPPVAGLVEPDAAAAGLNVARTAASAPGPIALVNSFASGGTLSSVVVKVRA